MGGLCDASNAVSSVAEKTKFKSRCFAKLKLGSFLARELEGVCSRVT